ncbi:hypothetical protein ACWOFR_01450 [Carnobacterium gallinarum]|uniref:hypothetical protein n=1 Tax=Carnobacterium gallinarum TaxID=2749 RepID=UPI000ADE0BCE|nr:hypothetical protein [Carnobacterium gallinarum]
MRTEATYKIGYIKGSGRPTNFQTIQFKDRYKIYRFKFQMGSGRYTLEEAS